jgi:hypothetical protein
MNYQELQMKIDPSDENLQMTNKAVFTFEDGTWRWWHRNVVEVVRAVEWIVVLSTHSIENGWPTGQGSYVLAFQ